MRLAKYIALYALIAVGVYGASYELFWQLIVYIFKQGGGMK